MGLISAIKKFFGGVKDRDVSGLAREAQSTDSLDAVHEIVDLSGGPLKEGHLRRALRDKALLPKAKPVGRTLGITKRKLWMPREDADRMFGGTHRTRNRVIRDLLPDKKQLERFGLPILETELDLASALGIRVKTLYHFSIHREKERQPHYVAVLMTEAQRQSVSLDGVIYHVPVGARHCVQGAPTSPGICNAILLRLDHRLAGLAKKRGLIYTRYADDLTFSGDVDIDTIHRFRTAATKLIETERFVVNRDKVRIMRQAARQSVTGVVVNKVLGLSRKERRKIRAMMHNAEKAGQTSPRLKGKLAYLAMLNPAQAKVSAAKL